MINVTGLAVQFAIILHFVFVHDIDCCSNLSGVATFTHAVL